VHRKQEELSKYITSAKPKKILTKVERKKLIIGYRKKIEDLSVRLHEHTARNINGFHINYKIHYLLHDPFTFVNAYTKISKNKGAMRKGFDDEGVMKFFGLKSAKIIANKLKKNQYELKPGKKKKTIY